MQRWCNLVSPTSHGACCHANAQVNPLKLLQGMGVYDDDEDAPPGRKKGRRGVGRAMAEADLGLDSSAPEPPGSLGAKLDDLGRSLLHELNTIAHKTAAGTGRAGTGTGAAGGDLDERGSTRSSLAQGRAGAARTGLGAGTAKGGSNLRR